jgi:hypothetical protein
MSLQTTLLTSHKGVDLHAATALRVMRDRLEDGDRLTGLFRCECHTFWDETFGGGSDRLLQVGRYYNPNKHRYGVFVQEGAQRPWFADCGRKLDGSWPGPVRQGDPAEAADLYEHLLGGAVPPGHCGFDVVAFPRGERGPVLSGVLWRLVIAGGVAETARAGENLAVARGRKQGLLINPHMEQWLATVRAIVS